MSNTFNNIVSRECEENISFHVTTIRDFNDVQAKLEKVLATIESSMTHMYLEKLRIGKD